MVERADALDGPVGEPLRERAVARVQPLGGAAQRPVGVRVLLEDAPDDLERRPPRRRDVTAGRAANSS